MWLEVFVREHRGHRDLPELLIHENDEMLQWGRRSIASPLVCEMAYFRAGMVISDTVKSIAESWLPEKKLPTYLDFACGYGRSLRFSCLDFGIENVWGSEILPDANTFVRDVLNARNFSSVTDPLQLEVSQRFDVIFVSSLFSHLPDSTFSQWIRTLHGLLEDDGLLVISVHDEDLLPPGERLNDEGFWFQETTEVESLDPRDYGAMVVCEDYVAQQIKRAVPDGHYERFRSALCFQQDLYAIPKQSTADLGRLRVVRGPQGAIDGVRSDNGELMMHGWAATQDPEDVVTSVEIRVNGEMLGIVAPTTTRPDVADVFRQSHREEFVLSGWTLRRRWPKVISPTSIVTATAFTKMGGRGTFIGLPVSELATN